MPITPAALFGGDQQLDFAGISPVEIFNRTAMQRASGLSALAMPAAPRQPSAQPEAMSPQDLFAEPTEPEVIPRNPVQQAPPPRGRVVSEAESEDYNAPAPVSQPPAAPGKYSDFADFMFESEARMQDGKLQVYQPPSGDGGGAYEVAGITARYQPREAARLKAMIDAGQNDEAVTYAKDFYRKRAAPFTSLTQDKGLQLELADTVHHRGEGGLRRVLQRAAGSDSRDYGELIGKVSLDAFHKARQDYEWEEVDRGRESRKKFRRGLQNRFQKAYEAARSF